MTPANPSPRKSHVRPGAPREQAHPAWYFALALLIAMGGYLYFQRFVILNGCLENTSPLGADASAMEEFKILALGLFPLMLLLPGTLFFVRKIRGRSSGALAPLGLALALLILLGNLHLYLSEYVNSSYPRSVWVNPPKVSLQEAGAAECGSMEKGHGWSCQGCLYVYEEERGEVLAWISVFSAAVFYAVFLTALFFSFVGSRLQNRGRRGRKGPPMPRKDTGK